MPAAGTWSALAGVSAPTRDLAWAVGGTTPAAGAAPRPLTERWDGSAWRAVPAPAADGAVLTAVWATATSRPATSERTTTATRLDAGDTSPASATPSATRTPSGGATPDATAPGVAPADDPS